MHFDIRLATAPIRAQSLENGPTLTEEGSLTWSRSAVSHTREDLHTTIDRLWDSVEAAAEKKAQSELQRSKPQAR